MVKVESDKHAQPLDTPAVRVLIVEDEPLYADQLEALLLGLGYEPIGPAPTAQVALALYRSEPIDLALLDIGLRGATNGLQLAAAHRRSRPAAPAAS